MRLLIGILAFLIWSAGSGYWYACKIKCACNAGISSQEADLPPIPGDPRPLPPDSAQPAANPPAIDSTGEDAEPAPPAALADEIKDTPAPTTPPPPAKEASPPKGQLKEKYTVLFSFARPIIQDRPDLLSYFSELASYLQANPGAKVLLLGYTDDTAARENNLKLGMRRAEAVAELLKKEGVDTSQMVLESKGEEDPVGDNNTKEGRQKNRRVEMQIIN